MINECRRGYVIPGRPGYWKLRLVGLGRNLSLRSGGRRSTAASGPLQRTQCGRLPTVRREPLLLNSIKANIKTREDDNSARKLPHTYGKLGTPGSHDMHRGQGCDRCVLFGGGDTVPLLLYDKTANTIAVERKWLAVLS